MHRSTSLSLPALALALTCATQPATAQDASACVNEVERLSESFSLAGANEQQGAIAQKPSARQGASLGPEQHKQISDLLQDARTAGERGDSQGCIQRLGQARTALREGGIGSAQPGSPTGTGLSPGSGGGASDRAGSSTIGPRAPDTGPTGAGPTGGTTGPAGAPAGSSTGGGASGGTTGGAAGGGTSGGRSGSGGGR
jgi:hypothetical protein